MMSACDHQRSRELMNEIPQDLRAEAKREASRRRRINPNNYLMRG